MFSYCDIIIKHLLLKKYNLQVQSKRRCNKRIFRTTFSKKLSNAGSATVECTLVLPLFIIGMLIIYHMAACLLTKTYIYEAFFETGQYLSENAYAYMPEEKEGISLKAAALKLAARKKLTGYLDNDDYVSRYVSGGMKGISFTQAEFKGDDYLYLTIKYTLKFHLPFFGGYRMTCSEKLRQKAYIGLRPRDDLGDEDIYVYMTETGEVYHRTRSCYHISLSIWEISERELLDKYTSLSPCRVCGRNLGDRHIYVTKSGDKYHTSISCSGLKRTVRRVKLKDIPGARPCKNCG